MTNYTWNARNQLTGISGPGIGAIYAYDGFGRLLSTTVNGASTDFLYDRSVPVQESDGGTVLANNLAFPGANEFLSRTDSTGTSYFLLDKSRSTIALANSGGAIQTEYAYAAFGGASTFTGVASNNPYKFRASYNDASGLRRITGKAQCICDGPPIDPFSLTQVQPPPPPPLSSPGFTIEPRPGDPKEPSLPDPPSSPSPGPEGGPGGSGGGDPGGGGPSGGGQEGGGGDSRGGGPRSGNETSPSKTFGERFRDNFRETWDTIGKFPWSLARGMITSGAVAGALDSAPALGWALGGFQNLPIVGGAGSFTIAETSVIVGATTAINAVLNGVAFGIGVGIGSAINAALGCC